VAKPIPPQLKLHPGEPLPAEQPDLGSLPSVADVCLAFERATGWPLSYICGAAPRQADDCWPIESDIGPHGRGGHLRLLRTAIRPAGAKARIEWETAHHLAAALSGALSELAQSRRLLWQREAELAAGVPVVPRPDERDHVAVRLQAILKSGARAVGCEAAGLYMLDADTTALKLRASWGLPFERLQEPARALAAALADLEALTGQIVVREAAREADPWNPPEEFPAWVCVPLSSATEVLGTLWFFCGHARPFTEEHTELLEVVAGRVAAELEREMLLAENVQLTRFKRQMESAGQWRQDQLPRVAPLLEGWDVSGWTNGSEQLAGDFYDWLVLPHDKLVISLGDPQQPGLPAALAGARLQAAVQAHARTAKSIEAMIRRVNHTYAAGLAGNDAASLFLGLLESETGQLRFSTAGDPEVMLLRDGAWQSLARPELPLGLERGAQFDQRQLELKPGDALVVVTDGVREALDTHGRMLGAAGIAHALLDHLSLPAKELAECLQAAVIAHQADGPASGQAALVLKRRRSS
jgi:serine phosphatase RsbU (regulator of sigma subunit)